MKDISEIQEGETVVDGDINPDQSHPNYPGPLKSVKPSYQISKSRLFLGDNIAEENDRGDWIDPGGPHPKLKGSMVYGVTISEEESEFVSTEELEKNQTTTRKLLDMYMSTLNTVELGNIRPDSISLDRFSELVTCCFTRDEFSDVLNVKKKSLSPGTLQVMAQTIQMLYRLRTFDPSTNEVNYTQIFSKCGYHIGEEYFYFTLNIADPYVRTAFFGSNGHFYNYFRYNISDIKHVPNRSPHPYNLLMYILEQCPMRNTTNTFEFTDTWSNIRYHMQLKQDEYASLAVFRKTKLTSAAKKLKEENMFEIKTSIPQRGAERLHFKVRILPNCSRYYDPKGYGQKMDEETVKAREKELQDPALKKLVLEAEDMISLLHKWQQAGNKNYLSIRDIRTIHEQMVKSGEEATREALMKAIKASNKNIIGLFRTICITENNQVIDVDPVSETDLGNEPLNLQIQLSQDGPESESKSSDDEDTDHDKWNMNGLW